ncbi:MAG: hypothetical protein KBS70_08010 [Bacteroidales bacterium]|nr:hypothetical protein [Candidatus Colicola caccequi]MBQ0154706.1 hypothetical protein [Candidatus Colicola equi]
MAKNNKKAENMETEVKNTKMHEYREHLKVITNGLIEMAKAAGRTEYKCNQLLRECYNLVDVELDTFAGWQSKGAQIRKGQHAYLFWGTPITTEAGYTFCPVNFLFAKDQVRFTANATA